LMDNGSVRTSSSVISKGMVSSQKTSVNRRLV
jgi:hypothetical protein